MAFVFSAEFVNTHIVKTLRSFGVVGWSPFAGAGLLHACWMWLAMVPSPHSVSHLG